MLDNSKTLLLRKVLEALARKVSQGRLPQETKPPSKVPPSKPTQHKSSFKVPHGIAPHGGISQQRFSHMAQGKFSNKETFINYFEESRNR